MARAGGDLARTPLGPTSRVVPLTEPAATDDSQLGRTAVDGDGYLTTHGRPPGAVWLGGTAVPPAAYLRAIAPIAAGLLAGKPIPAKAEVKPAKLETAKYVSKDDPKLWTWVIFPPGFEAPAMKELAKRQAWTLEPAVLGSGGKRRGERGK